MNIHPKISAVGITSGLTLLVEAAFAFLGVPAPPWVAPLVPVIAGLIAGYLKAS